MPQVLEIRRQANEALQHAQAEITEAEQAAAAAHKQVVMRLVQRSNSGILTTLYHSPPACIILHCLLCGNSK